MNTFILRVRDLRSLLSVRICRRVAASLCVLLIAFAALAATSAGKQEPAAGANLMLRPGWSGLAPALY